MRRLIVNACAVLVLLAAVASAQDAWHRSLQGNVVAKKTGKPVARATPRAAGR